jgi:hypothetical protein
VEDEPSSLEAPRAVRPWKLRREIVVDRVNSAVGRRPADIAASACLAETRCRGVQRVQAVDARAAKIDAGDDGRLTEGTGARVASAA